MKERDHDSHCPILVAIEPSDLPNQEKKNYPSDLGRKERADKRKAAQKARKAKGKAKASQSGILFIRKDNLNSVYFPSGERTVSLAESEYVLTIRYDDSLSDYSIAIYPLLRMHVLRV